MMGDLMRILVVEDNPGDVRLLQEMFSGERLGSFELTHMPRLGLALNHLAKGEVDIVLLDLGLPDGDGMEIVRKVRAVAPQTPLVVLTGRDDDAMIAEAMLEGAQDYLVKGQIEQRALPRALRHAIERFSLLNKTAQVNIELERRVKEKDILLGEIHHRVKNSLQVVSSLLSLEGARIQDATICEMLQTTQNRIRSMALIHQTLYQSKDFARVDFHAFLRSFVPTLIQSYSIHPERIVLRFEVAEVHLPIEEAIPCGLIVNELVSNALKHAFPDGRSGRIDVDFRQDGANHVTLQVSDDGKGIPEDFDFDRSETLGVQLVNLLAGQLRGTVTVQRRNPTQFVVRFPLAA
ncbi:MAG TPA: histidine kinase dimerization/phosphoacceptor domain -containing protein [Acidobacteriaceae bacterium]